MTLSELEAEGTTEYGMKAVLNQKTRVFEEQLRDQGLGRPNPVSCDTRTPFPGPTHDSLANLVLVTDPSPLLQK
jgi:hypothetical protein